MPRALISVYDKTNIVEFAKGLSELGFDLISTGGTYKKLKEDGLSVMSIEEVTGFPEILDGRVKTLHPRLYAGILAKDTPGHLSVISGMDISRIDLVCCNLYPFEATVTRQGAAHEEIVEEIDIGGPSMLRAAAKNYRSVLVVVKPERYQQVLSALRSPEGPGEDFRLALAHEAFAHTAAYDALIENYFARLTGRHVLEFPEDIVFRYKLAYPLRYGENPHQKAAFYRDILEPSGIPAARVLQGKQLSYNNIADLDAAVNIVSEFDVPCAAAIKHATPCGVGVADDLPSAYARAYASDPVAIFGGIVAFNRQVNGDLASELVRIFLEVVAAPGYTTEALQILSSKKDLRVLAIEPLPLTSDYRLKRVRGGLLVQSVDPTERDFTYEVVTNRAPGASEIRDLSFAWRVVKHARSNAIVLAKDGMTVGIGSGQVSRIAAARIAIAQAGEKAKGAVMASDAFFPFSDVVEAASKAGVTAIVQPGGSRKDDDSVSAADASGMAMVFTGKRHFLH
ncbi:MAG: bifunctional phosphoribosylaminoimidazolecarboxamide formyltransferase/IMP cyclohydrolase [Bacillota bacterium]